MNYFTKMHVIIKLTLSNNLIYLQISIFIFVTLSHQIYDQAINEQFEKLIQLRGMVMEITSELDINEDDNLLAEEILLLSQKLEDVRSALTSLNDFTNDEKNEVLIQELMETKTCISSAKKVIFILN